MGKSNKKRAKTRDGDQSAEHPYWWCHQGEHPAWCVIPHADGDYGSDRACLSGWERQVRLSLPDAARIRREHNGEFAFDVHPYTLVVHLHQRYRECAPRIVMTPDPTNQGTRYDLTRDEAEALGRACWKVSCSSTGNPSENGHHSSRSTDDHPVDVLKRPSGCPHHILLPLLTFPVVDQSGRNPCGSRTGTPAPWRWWRGVATVHRGR